MNIQIKVAAATATFGCLFAASAQAGCGLPDLVSDGKSALALRLPAQERAATEALAGLGAAAQAPAVLPQGSTAQGQGQAIVGMWKFTFTSVGNLGIPDGTVLDAGFQLWHDDGTEITNSSRPPKTSNFCLGAWDYRGNVGYRLNHFALSWDAGGDHFIGPANIRERIKVDRGGNRFSGVFSIDQYAQDGSTVLVHLEGTVAGTRILAH